MDQNVNNIIKTLPPVGQDIAKSLWGELPGDMRQELSLVMGALTKIVAKNPMAANDLIQLLKRQADPAVQPLSSIAVVGPVNVGKSTLFNAILAGTGDVAEVSAIPGTTKVNQRSNVGLFSMIDTPGLDHARQEGAQEQDIALEAARKADFLLVVFDIFRSITTSDLAMYRHLKSLNKPMMIVLNKSDLLQKKDQKRALAEAAKTLGLDIDEVRLISAEKKVGIERLLLEIAAVEPRLLGEMGKSILPLRHKLSWQAIRRAAVASCSVALLPLPVVDLIPLTAVQVSLVLTLSRIYDQKMNFARAKEIIGSLGVGLLARELFQQLSKLGGPPGWLLSASIATSATVIIGFATMQWFETGEKPDNATIKKLTGMVQGILAAAFKTIAFKGKKKSGQRQLLEAEVDSQMQNITRKLDAESAPKIQTDAPQGQSDN